MALCLSQARALAMPVATTAISSTERDMGGARQGMQRAGLQRGQGPPMADPPRYARRNDDRS
jgi:hypothetical protein